MHKLTRVIYKFIPTFGKLTVTAWLVIYKAKSMDKLVNHSCQFMYSLACFTYVANRFLLPFKFLIFICVTLLILNTTMYYCSYSLGYKYKLLIKHIKHISSFYFILVTCYSNVHCGCEIKQISTFHVTFLWNFWAF